MATFTKVNGLTITHTDMESILLSMADNIKEIGNTILEMDLVKNLSLIQFSRENTKKAKKTVKAHL